MFKTLFISTVIFTSVFSINTHANQPNAKPQSNIDLRKSATRVLEEDTTQLENKDDWLIELEDIVRPEIPEKKKEKAQAYITKFAKQSQKCKDWKDFKKSCQTFYEKLDELLEGEDSVKVDEYFKGDFCRIRFEEIVDARIEQFIDEFLKEEGLLVKTLDAYYWVYFETDHKYFSFSRFKKMRSIRYKVIDRIDFLYGSSKTFENADLILLNKDSFEIARVPVGNIESYKNSTGKFQLLDSEYKKIREVELQSQKN